MAPEIWQGKDYDAKVGSLYSIKFVDLFIWKGWAINSAWKCFAVRLVECWGHSVSASHWEAAIYWEYLFPGATLGIE
jgi:hypothetical protein